MAVKTNCLLVSLNQHIPNRETAMVSRLEEGIGDWALADFNIATYVTKRMWCHVSSQDLLRPLCGKPYASDEKC